MLTKWLVLFLSLMMFACGTAEVSQQQSAPEPSLVASAELIALDNATLGPPLIKRMWQFKIKKMAPENSFVKKGDVVLEFDGQKLKDYLISRKSSLAAEIKKGESDRLKDEAKHQQLVLDLAEAEMNFEKAQRKVEIIDVSRSAIDKKLQQSDFLLQQEKLRQAKQALVHHEQAVKLNREVSQGRINNYRQRVINLSSEIAKLKVKAPKDGLVMYLEDSNGEKAAPGETVYLGRTLVQLPSLDRVALKAEFTEPYAAKLKVGQTVKVVFDAYPESAFIGSIEKLGRAFFPKSVQSPKVVFDVEIKLGNDRPDVMRPGMKAKVEVSAS